MDDRRRLAVVASDGLRLPPHSMEAEANVIGALILDNQAFERVSHLKADDFYSADHRGIWCAVVEMIEKDLAVDVMTLAEYMGPESPWKYVAEVVRNVPTSANIHRYADIVRGKADLRRLIAYAMDVQEAAYSLHANPSDVVRHAESSLGSMLERRDGRDMVSYEQAIKDAIDEEDDDRRGFDTGLVDLDRMMPRGMLPGQLIIIAARTSMGKSSLALGIAEHVARQAGVAVFSLEMTRAELAIRGLNWETKGEKIRRSDAIGRMKQWRMRIDDTPSATVAHIRSRSQRARREIGSLGLIVVDHLQLMKGTGESRHLELSGIAKGLKAIAKDLCCPVVLLSQLNRGVESRTDKRPALSDLRESGAIEEDADIVWMLYRDSYYVPDSHMGNTAELLVKKNRGGRTGEVLLTWIPEHTRFVNHSGQRPVPPSEPKPAGKRIARAPGFVRSYGERDE